MTMVSTAEIAKIFNEIRDQRDAANKRAEAAKTRTAQAETERDEARRALEQARRELKEYRDMQAAYMRGEVPIDKITIA